MGTSMMRFSTSPSSVTMTTRARPGPRWTNSICFSRRSVFGATTRPAQRDRPESMVVASSSTSGEAAAGGRAFAVDVLALFLAEAAQLQQPADEQAEAALGRQAAGRGMRRIEQAGILQIRHDVADGGRRQRHGEPARNRARADGLTRFHVGVDDVAQDFARPLVEIGEPCARLTLGHLHPSFPDCRWNVVMPPDSVNAAPAALDRRPPAG